MKAIMETDKFRGEIVKKILLSLIFLFLLTGCTAEYKLEINKSSVEETLSINIDGSKLGTEGIKLIENNKQLVFDNGQEDYYEQVFEQSNDEFRADYNYEHKNNTFDTTSFISMCYPENSIINTEDTLTISTDGIFACYNMYGNEKVENTRVVISTNLEVIDNNADEIDGNNYIWTIDETNYYEKPIFIEIDKSGVDFNLISLVVVVIISILIVALIIYLVVRRRYNEMNKI